MNFFFYQMRHSRAPGESILKNLFSSLASVNRIYVWLDLLPSRDKQRKWKDVNQTVWRNDQSSTKITFILRGYVVIQNLRFLLHRELNLKSTQMGTTEPITCICTHVNVTYGVPPGVYPSLSVETRGRAKFVFKFFLVECFSRPLTHSTSVVVSYSVESTVLLFLTFLFSSLWNSRDWVWRKELL